MPKVFDLGEFGREAERLLHLSLRDPKHPEYASIACINDKGRLVILKEPIRGDERSVPVPAPKDKRRVLLLHTHGDTDTPFSASDLEGLFVPSAENGVPAVLLATPSLKMLILRTKDTPYLTPLQIEDRTVMMWLHPATEEERKLFEAGYQAAGGEEADRPPELTPEYKQALRQLSSKRMFVLTRAAHEYNLKGYSCPSNQNIVSLLS